MKRKIIALNEEVKKAQEKLAEVEQLRIEAEKEEQNLVASVQAQIGEIEKTSNVFIGVVLTHQDLLAVLDIALKTGESVKVPFRIYINE